MSKQVHALNTISGQVGLVPASYLDHPVLGESLVEVPEGTKSYDPKFYKGTTKDEHKQKETTKRKEENESNQARALPVVPSLDSDLQ